MKKIESASSTPTQGIQSVEHAFAILNCFKKANGPMSITELSIQMNMSKSRIHKYLVSFTKIGVINQNKIDLTYSMGAKVIELGLSALQQFDIVSIAEPYLSDLRSQLNQSVALAIWSEEGPMIVKFEESNKTINIKLRVGIPYPILVSAVGRCFAAFLPVSQTQHLIEQEIMQYQLTKEEVETELNNIREKHLAIRDIKFEGIPGGMSIASPIFDYNGDIVAVIAIVGFEGELNYNETSKQVIKLKETVKQLSKL